jgi:hypothetical protein
VLASLIDLDARSGTQPTGFPGGSYVFSGNVIWFERGRENATDTFLRLHA